MRNKNVNMTQGAMPRNGLIITWNNHMFLTRTMPMRISSSLSKMLIVATAYHHHHRNIVIIMTH